MHKRYLCQNLLFLLEFKKKDILCNKYFWQNDERFFWSIIEKYFLSIRLFYLINQPLWPVWGRAGQWYLSWLIDDTCFSHFLKRQVIDCCLKNFSGQVSYLEKRNTGKKWWQILIIPKDNLVNAWLRLRQTQQSIWFPVPTLLLLHSVSFWGFLI